MFSWPLWKSVALLSVGAPSISITWAPGLLFSASARPWPCSSPTFTLSNET